MYSDSIFYPYYNLERHIYIAFIVKVKKMILRRRWKEGHIRPLEHKSKDRMKTTITEN